MQERTLDLPLPIGGLVTNTAFDKQPPGTYPVGQNVRGYEPTTGRNRLGVRSGLRKYVPLTVAGPNAVTNISLCTTTYQLGLAGMNPLAGSLAIWALHSAGWVNTSGFQGYVDSFITAATGSTAFGSCWDGANDLYIAQVEAGPGLALQIYSFEYQSYPLFTQLWKTAIPTGYHLANVVGMCTGGGYLWVLTADSANANVYLYQIYGSTNGTGVRGQIVTSTYIYTNAKSVPSFPLCCNNLAYATDMNTGHPVLCMGYSDGTVDLLDAVTLQATNKSIITGYPINDIDSDGSAFYIVGGAFGGLIGGLIVKLTTGAHGVWSNSYSYLTSCCYDPVNSVVAVTFGPGTVGGGGGTVAVNTLNPATGALVNQLGTSNANGYCIRPSGTGGYIVQGFANSAGSLHANSLYLNKTLTLVANPSYAIESAPYQNWPPGISVNQSLASAGSGTNPSNTRGLAVSQGAIVRFTPTSVTTLAPPGTLLISNVPVFSAEMLQQVHFVDGENYVFYDSFSDSVKTLVASQGQLPRDSAGAGARLIAVWRNRLVVSGLPYDPNNWFMSAVADATNWNYNPSPSVETQAVAGNNIVAEENSDIITALVPYNDEIILFGGSRTIYQMTGDPMSGGRIDLVTDQIGMVWGNAWCRDGMGNLYFMSQTGSIYQFAPGAIPQRISDPVSEIVSAIQTGQFVVSMAWDERQHGFHIWMTPFIYAGQTVQHLFYDANNTAWHMDTYNSNLMNPICARTFVGPNASDRLNLIGCLDGYIRAVDPTAISDDGFGINSTCFIGPIKDDAGNALTLADVQVQLADSFANPVYPTNMSGPMSYGINSGPSCEQALWAPSVFLQKAQPGRNRSTAIRATAQAHYIGIVNNGASTDPPWQIDYIKIRVRTPDGTGRQRIF